MISGHSLDKPLSDVGLEDDTKDASVFDNLLKILGSNSKKLASIYRKRLVETNYFLFGYNGIKANADVILIILIILVVYCNFF